MKEKDLQHSTTGQKQLLFAILSSLLGLALALFLAEWALGIYSENLRSESMDDGLIRYHALLGWTLAPDWEGIHKHHDYEALYSTNASGFRNQSLPANIESKKITAVLGDSFTFGLGVNDEETFISRLNQNTENNQSTDLFINYAIPGTSTDQQLLLLNQVLDNENPDEVLLVVYLPNDLLDNTLDYPLQAQQGKPRFTLSQNQLSLTNTPVPLQSKPAALQQMTLGSIVLKGFDNETAPASYLSQFQLYRLVAGTLQEQHYSENEATPILKENLAPALALFTALVDTMNTNLKSRDIKMRIALLPGREAMLESSGISHHFQNYLRQAIADYLNRNEIEVIDLMDALSVQSESSLRTFYYPNDGHLTPAGHQFIALTLANALRN